MVCSVFGVSTGTNKLSVKITQRQENSVIWTGHHNYIFQCFAFTIFNIFAIIIYRQESPLDQSITLRVFASKLRSSFQLKTIGAMIGLITQSHTNVTHATCFVSQKSIQIAIKKIWRSENFDFKPSSVTFKCGFFPPCCPVQVLSCALFASCIFIWTNKDDDDDDLRCRVKTVAVACRSTYSNIKLSVGKVWRWFPCGTTTNISEEKVLQTGRKGWLFDNTWAGLLFACLCLGSLSHTVSTAVKGSRTCTRPRLSTSCDHVT